MVEILRLLCGDLKSFVTQYGDGQVNTYTNLILKRQEEYKNVK